MKPKQEERDERDSWVARHSRGLIFVSLPNFDGRYSLWSEFSWDSEGPTICLALCTHACFILVFVFRLINLSTGFDYLRHNITSLFMCREPCRCSLYIYHRSKRWDSCLYCSLVEAVSISSQISETIFSSWGFSLKASLLNDYCCDFQFNATYRSPFRWQKQQ